MIQDNITQIKFLLKKQGPLSLVYRLVFFILSRTNQYLDNLKYFLYEKNNNPIISVEGSLMKLNSKDKGLSKDLLLHKKREHLSTDFIKSFIKEEDIIIDIGANIGYYALLEAKIAKKGKVYAIEPVSENRKFLIENIKLNNYKNISVYPYAISDKTGKKQIYVYDKKNWSSFTKNPFGKIIKNDEVNAIKLDDFIKLNLKKSPTFIRMDTEGHEYEIINGMKKILESKKPLKLFIEFHSLFLSEKKIKEVMNVLKDNNFKIIKIFNEIHPQNHKSLELFCYLCRKIGFHEFGEFKKTDYNSLRSLLLEGYSTGMFYFPEVFFERK